MNLLCCFPAHFTFQLRICITQYVNRDFGYFRFIIQMVEAI